MITRRYCVTMARYNAWQNCQLYGFLEAMEPRELSRERGAFFGSILGTLNHLLWGDGLWTARFDGGEAPAAGIEASAALHVDLAGWQAAREALDRRISGWAGSVKDEALQSDLVYYSGIAGREMRKPMAICVMQLFNHQTHHRGQVHAMLTAAGSQAPVSDLPFMPDAAGGA